MITKQQFEQFLGVRKSAFFEITIYLFIVIASSNLFSDGTRFLDMSPHPFWGILLLVSAQYGRKEALFCVFFCTLFLYTGNLPKQTISQNSYDYLLHLTLLPILWLIVSVTLSGIKYRKDEAALESESLTKKYKKQLDVITTSYNKLKNMNTALETKLASEVGSAVKIYNAVKELDKIDSNLIEAAGGIISSTLNPEKYSIYILEDDILSQRGIYGWGQGDSYQESFYQKDKIFQEVVINKRIITILNKDDLSILKEEGILAGPIIDSETGAIFGMLKIEDLKFDGLNSRNLHTFKMLCNWIGGALNNAKKLEDAEDASILNHSTRLYSNTFLEQQEIFLKSIAWRINFDFSKIVIKLTNAKKLDDIQRDKATSLMGESIRSVLRSTDQLFDQNQNGESFALLLPGTSQTNCNFVIEKIKEKLFKSEKSIECATYSFIVENLYTKAEKAPYAN